MSGTGMKVERVKFDAEMKRFAREYNLNIGEEMTNQMRLWCGDNIKNFPPSVNMQKRAGEKKAGAKQRLDIKSDQALGKRAIANDLTRILHPMTPVEISTTREMGPGMFGGKMRFETQKGKVWLVDADLYKEGASQTAIRTFHERHRVKNGRVTSAGTRTRNIGRWKSTRRLHVSEKSRKTYVTARQKKVGQLKSGWVKGLFRFGGKIPGKWISQGWMAHGSAGGQIDTSGDGVLWAINRVRYASDHKRTSDFNASQRPRLAIKAMKKKRDAMVRAENRRRSA